MIIDTEFVIAILKFWFLLKTLDEKLESFFLYKNKLLCNA